MIARFCRFIVRIFFREIVIEGTENLPAAGPVIFTPNHPNSLLDPLLIFLVEPQFRIRFVAKATLFKIPVFASILRKIGAIPVVRKFEATGHVDYSAFFETSVRALQSGDSIVIFPEGRSLPQPYLAPLKTGPARLFFLARQRGVDVKIIPIGLNYERSMIFRSSVQISISPPISTNTLVHSQIEELTEAVRVSLDRAVFQAQDYRDRDLLLLLERLYSEESLESWHHRLPRLKQFELSLAKLRNIYPREIENLRQLLSRYQRLSDRFGRAPDQKAQPASGKRVLFLHSFGFIIAIIGSILNWIPYRLIGWLVRKKDHAEAATFKIVYAIFLFPAFYILEGAFIRHFLGWVALVLFLILIVPLTLFTLRFYERREYTARTPWRFSRRIDEQLTRLRARIIANVDSLAARL